MKNMTFYHLSEAERALGSRPIEEIFQVAPAPNLRFRMPDEDLAALMNSREIDYGIGGPPSEKKYDDKTVPLTFPPYFGNL